MNPSKQPQQCQQDYLSAEQCLEEVKKSLWLVLLEIAVFGIIAAADIWYLFLSEQALANRPSKRNARAEQSAAPAPN